MNAQSPLTQAPPLGRYEIDAGQSRVTFRTRHMFGLAPVRGTLTVRDVSRPVSLSVGRVSPAGHSFTAAAALRVDRTEFGVTAMPGLAGRYLDLTVEVRCTRR